MEQRLTAHPIHPIRQAFRRAQGAVVVISGFHQEASTTAGFGTE